MAILNNPAGALAYIDRHVAARRSGYYADDEGEDGGGGGGGGECDWEKGKKACEAYTTACHARCKDRGGVDRVSCGYDCDGSTNNKECTCIRGGVEDPAEVLSPLSF